MSEALKIAREYGLRVVLSDLGDWGSSTLYAEYDARCGEIRVNVRIAEGLDPQQLDAFVALAVGHELYHHREARGEIAIIGDRRVREAAADAFARALARPVA